MSKSFNCKCPERKKPTQLRDWTILKYKYNESAFGGGRKQVSNYSTIICNSCGACGRTNAKYVDTVWEAQQLRQLSKKYSFSNMVAVILEALKRPFGGGRRGRKFHIAFTVQEGGKADWVAKNEVFKLKELPEGVRSSKLEEFIRREFAAVLNNRGVSMYRILTVKEL